MKTKAACNPSLHRTSQEKSTRVKVSFGGRSGSLWMNRYLIYISFYAHEVHRICSQCMVYTIRRRGRYKLAPTTMSVKEAGWRSTRIPVRSPRTGCRTNAKFNAFRILKVEECTCQIKQVSTTRSLERALIQFWSRTWLAISTKTDGFIS